MPRLPDRPNLALLLLRLAAGGFMMVHGLQKAARYGELTESFADPIGLGPATSATLAIFAEVVCAALVIFGALTRAALVPLLVTMAVAFFVVHGDDPWRKRELAALFGVTYVVLFISGPGRYSVDAWWRTRRDAAS